MTPNIQYSNTVLLYCMIHYPMSCSEHKVYYCLRIMLELYMELATDDNCHLYQLTLGYIIISAIEKSKK